MGHRLPLGLPLTVTVTPLPILLFPDPLLRRTAAPVDNVDGAVVELIDSMLDTMYAAPGIGLAATQVDVHRRIVVIDVSDESDSPLVLVNPELLVAEGAAEMQEGCLSIPGVYETVKRPSEVRVRAVDREGQPYELDADGLLAVCIQHEIDHLDGKLFVDYLSPLKRNRIRRKMQKRLRDGDEDDEVLA
jgi:peptide deformylase